MSNDSKFKVYPPTAKATANAHISSLEQYHELYNRSINDPDGFWTEQAERLDWIEKWHTLCESDYDKAKIRWFIGGKLNACYNCVDRHVDDGHGEDTALIWEGNDPNESRTFTYAELQAEVQKAANALKDLGLAKGDRVCIYMQMIPELTIAMLACTRIGVVHSIVFGAFSADSLVTRINDSECKAIITQDTGVRGTKLDIPMKANADKAVESTPSIEKILVVKRTGAEVAMADEPRRVVARRPRGGRARLRRRADGRRGSAVHPLHLRQHRQTEGRAAHHRRLSHLRRDDASLCF